ncbi:MAG: SRPBCC domain-containing protein [Chloroflexota bacterium]
MRDRATVERTSERELVVTRTVGAPPQVVFDAWTTPELFRRWWVPRSFPITLQSLEMDVRVGGGYRLVFGHEGATMEFFGRYLEVAPPSRLVWTNDEDDGGQTVTTVTFEARDGTTLLTIHDLYPSAEALEAGTGSTDAMPESLDQLEELLATLDGDGRGLVS